MLRHTRSVSRELAEEGLATAVRTAEDTGVKICVAIVDGAGVLVAFVRMDGSPLQSVQLSIDKAYSSAANGMSGQEFWNAVQREPWLVSGIQRVSGLNWLGGGIPVRHDGEVVGAVGVSSDHGMDEDILVANAVVDRMVGLLDADRSHRAGR